MHLKNVHTWNLFILIFVLSLTARQVVQSVAKELVDYLCSFLSIYRQFLDETAKDLLIWTKQCFSINSILKREDSTTPIHFRKIFEASFEFGLYSPDLTLQQFEQEYHQFCKHVKLETQNAEHTAALLNKNTTIDSLIYIPLIHEAPAAFSNVIKLLGASMGRTYCESIVEGY